MEPTGWPPKAQDLPALSTVTAPDGSEMYVKRNPANQFVGSWWKFSKSLEKILLSSNSAVDCAISEGFEVSGFGIDLSAADLPVGSVVAKGFTLYVKHSDDAWLQWEIKPEALAGGFIQDRVNVSRPSSEVDEMIADGFSVWRAGLA